MRFPDHFLAEIKDRVSILSVCSRRVTLKKAGQEWCGLSPFNTERKPSFYVNERKQAWFDFSAQLNGDIFKFVMLTDGLTFPAAVEILAAEAGVAMPAGYKTGEHYDPQAQEAEAKRRAEHERSRAKQQAADQRRTKSVREFAYDIWKEGRSIIDTPADWYLRSRGIDFAADAASSLRFVEKLDHTSPETGEITQWPALIAAVRTPQDGRFLAIWRIYIDPRTYGKAPLPNPKLGLGRYAEEGGSVWIGKPTAVANVCEGIETAFGVRGILRNKQGVQAALSTSGMVNFVPPKGCRSVLIWPDGDVAKIRADKRTGIEKTLDGAGFRAAKTLNLRLTEAKVPCSIQPIPGRAIDWLDCYNASKGILNNG